jgi:hypothetical protein
VAHSRPTMGAGVFCLHFVRSEQQHVMSRVSWWGRPDHHTRPSFPAAGDSLDISACCPRAGPFAASVQSVQSCRSVFREWRLRSPASGLNNSADRGPIDGVVFRGVARCDASPGLGKSGGQPVGTRVLAVSRVTGNWPEGFASVGRLVYLQTTIRGIGCITPDRFAGVRLNSGNGRAQKVRPFAFPVCAKW